MRPSRARAVCYSAHGLMRRSFVVLTVLIHASCIDPVHNDAVDALGPEESGVRPGPTHRPGQPCRTCHGSDGPANPEMTVGGTVYAVRGGTDPAEGVSVALTDAKGATYATTSNSVGNFYVWKRDWDPIFPLQIAISDGNGVNAVMVTKIGRDGACATCHRGSGDALHMPGVYLRAQ